MTDLTDEELMARVREAFARQGTLVEVTDVRSLPGGVSSLTYAAQLVRADGTRPVVVKVAPPGVEPVRNRDVLRQARILSALGAHANVPVPAVLATDAGDPPLFVMDLAAGDSYEPGTDVLPHPPTAGVVRTRAIAAARTLARMQAVTPVNLGVADEDETSPGAELRRWARLLETVDPALAPGHEGLHARLADHIPAPLPARLLHGDYRLGNMLFDGDRLTAVIDWEIWSLGDPRHDLAWLQMHADPPHYFRTERPAADRAAGAAMPSRADLLAAYLAEAAALDGGLDHAVAVDLDWFRALGHYKVVSTVAVLAKRNRRLAQPDPQLLVAEASLPTVVAGAHTILDDAGRA